MTAQIQLHPAGGRRTHASGRLPRRAVPLVAVTIVACLLAVLLAPVPQGQANNPDFDFDTGNAPLDIVIPASEAVISSRLKPSDATLILRITALTNSAWFDAIAPYHSTAVGISTRLDRRPPAERQTNRQRNVAILHASYHVLLSLVPDAEPQWREMLTSLGLDPDDTSRDTTTPVGIGNVVGAAVVASRLHDGMNQLGDEGGRTYHRQPYADYLGYKPVNTAEVLRNPARWQPDVVTEGNGVFRVQEFVTPQYAVTRPYSYANPKAFSVPPPRDSDPVRNPDAYRRQADEVIAASAALTDYQKAAAEHFNNKIASLASSVIYLAETRNYSLDEFVFHEFLTNLASFDTGIAVWHFKLRYDAVRPFSAIRYLYGDRRITAWGGPGHGTVTDLPGAHWRSYLDTADHPEYPSGSTAFCAAHAQASRRFTGSDELGQSVLVPKGSLAVEPGVAPSADLVLGPWPTWTQWEEECGESRLWGGVHFRDAITAVGALGKEIGDCAYTFVSAHIRGVARDDGGAPAEGRPPAGRCYY